jgi:hypothetical protein
MKGGNKFTKHFFGFDYENFIRLKAQGTASSIFLRVSDGTLFEGSNFFTEYRFCKDSI